MSLRRFVVAGTVAVALVLGCDLDGRSFATDAGIGTLREPPDRGAPAEGAEGGVGGDAGSNATDSTAARDDAGEPPPLVDDSDASVAPPSVPCVSRAARLLILDAFNPGTATAVSSDGRFVVGSVSGAQGQRAFRWSIDGGLENLGALVGASASSARAVSADGSVVVGVSTTPLGDRAFRWTEVTGMQDLGVILDASDSNAAAVSADGNIVAGDLQIAGSSSFFRWTGPTGMQRLGAGTAQGMSADGSIIVGYAEASFRWTVAGSIDLGASLTPGSAWAAASSADGLVIVGYRLDANGNYRGFHYTSELGATDLPLLVGDTPEIADAYAYAVNADGTTVVGSEDNGTSSAVLDAFVWTPARGTRRVVDLVPAAEVPSGWRLRRANAVSADGGVIAGEGNASIGEPNQAWVAQLAVTCP